MTNVNETPNFTVQSITATDDKSFVVDLNIDNEEQKRWLADKVQLHGELADNVIENDMRAFVKLSCNGHCDLCVENVSTLYTFNFTGVDTCRLDADEKAEFVGYLVDYLTSQEQSIPRWLEEMSYSSVDAPSLSLRHLEYIEGYRDFDEKLNANFHENTLAYPQQMYFGCPLSVDNLLTDTIMNRSDIIQTVAKNLNTDERNVNTDELRKRVSEIAGATFVATVNPDLTVDAIIQFSPTIDFAWEESCWLDKASIALTDNEYKTILEKAAKQKDTIIYTMRQREEAFNKSWQYLIPKNDEHGEHGEDYERLPSVTEKTEQTDNKKNAKKNQGYDR